MILAGLLRAGVSLIAGVLIGGLGIHMGVWLSAEEANPVAEESFSIAAVGSVLAVVVTLLLGWIPLIGTILPAAAWVGVVGHWTDIRPPAAVGVGVIVWAIAFVMTTGISIILFGGFQ